MNPRPKEKIIEYQKEIMRMGCEFSEIIRPLIAPEEYKHIKDLFIANEYGEAIYSIKWLTSENIIKIDAYKQRKISDIEFKIQQIEQIYNC